MGLHNSITYSFLPVGHTKFSPDWCFGLLKQRLRNSKVDRSEDLVGVVEKSSSVNIAQLNGTQKGEVLVKTYNWEEILSPAFKKVPQIKRLHHFYISKTDEGIPLLKVKKHHNDAYKNIDIIQAPILSTLPEQIIPKGLSLERQWYLHNKIRGFCSEECQDLVCPRPVEPDS